MTLIANAPTYTPYPIADGEQSNAIIQPSEEQTQIEFLGLVGDYGNLYWTSEDGSKTLSWKGCPHRYFRIPDEIDIESISRFYSSRDMKTTFHPNIYKGGAIYAVVPASSPSASYVMAAAYVEDTLVAIIMLDTEHSFETVVVINNSPSATLEENEWVEIGRHNYGRTELPWRFDLTGKKAIHPNGATIAINDELTEAIFTESLFVNILASQTVTQLGFAQRFPTGLDVYILRFNMTSVDVRLSGDNYWAAYRFTRDYTNKIFFDENSECQIILTSTSETPAQGQLSEIKVQQISANPLEMGPMTIFGPDTYTGVPNEYSAQNAVGTVSWTFPSIPSVCSMNGGPGSITARDECGRSASKTVTLPGGEFGDIVIIGDEPWSGNNYSDYHVENSIGDVTWTWPSDICGTQTISATDSCGRTAIHTVSGIGGGVWEETTDMPQDFDPTGMSIGDSYYYENNTIKVTLNSVDAILMASSSVCGHPVPGWNGTVFIPQQQNYTSFGWGTQADATCGSASFGFPSEVLGGKTDHGGGAICWNAATTFNYSSWMASGAKGDATGKCGYEVMGLIANSCGCSNFDACLGGGTYVDSRWEGTYCSNPAARWQGYFRIKVAYGYDCSVYRLVCESE